MAKQSRFTGANRGRWLRRFLLSALLPALLGCDNFFTNPTNSGGGGGSGGSTGGSGSNYIYVLNSATSTISGFLVGTNTLTRTPGSPYALSFLPQGAVVARSNNFLYVAGPGALYLFTINSDGSLSTGSQAIAIASELSLAVSPDGQWLFGLNSQSATLDEWQINSSNGALTGMPSATYTVTGATPVPLKIFVSPLGNYVFAALGTGGDEVFTLNTSTGAIAASQHLSLTSSLSSDNSLVTNPAGTILYIARSGQNGGVGVYTIGASGLLTSISGSPFATGQGPFDLAVDNAGKYVYVANRTDATISGFTIGAGGGLTALNGSPFAAGSLPTSIVPERSGTYLLAAAAGGGPDLTMYSFDATVPGKLDVAVQTASGSDPAGSTLIAATH